MTLVVPARGTVRAAWRNARGAGAGWMPRLRAHVNWVARWRPAAMPDGDAIVATAWQSAPVVAAAPTRSGVPFYLVQHYESLYHGAPAQVDATYRLPLRKIVISTWLAGIMRDRFGAVAPVVVTPVDPDLFHRVPGARSGPGPRVLMLHHEYAWKGVADGLEAVRRVKVRVPALRLVGFGVKAPRGHSPYDEFHADVDQAVLAALYSGCDIYLCPSWDEGLGMPSMEAMACGAALVTYDNGGSRDYATDGDTALVARRRDVDDLAAKLERMVRDAALRARLASAGAAFITTAFDWDRAVRRMEELLLAPPHA